MRENSCFFMIHLYRNQTPASITLTRKNFPHGLTICKRHKLLDLYLNSDYTRGTSSMYPNRTFAPRTPRRVRENVNETIRAREVRAVFPDGTVEIMKTDAAIRKAKELGLDLICIAPTAEPPVAKAMVPSRPHATPAAGWVSSGRTRTGVPPAIVTLRS